jgi:hypothetical protein
MKLGKRDKTQAKWMMKRTKEKWALGNAKNG